MSNDTVWMAAAGAAGRCRGTSRKCRGMSQSGARRKGGADQKAQGSSGRTSGREERKCENEANRPRSNRYPWRHNHFRAAGSAGTRANVRKCQVCAAQKRRGGRRLALPEAIRPRASEVRERSQSSRSNRYACRRNHFRAAGPVGTHGECQEMSGLRGAGAEPRRAARLERSARCPTLEGGEPAAIRQLPSRASISSRPRISAQMTAASAAPPQWTRRGWWISQGFAVVWPA